MEVDTIKKLNSWNKVKQNIDINKKRVFFVKNRQIWNIYVGKNIWYESNGKWDFFIRPVLIIKVVWNVAFIVDDFLEIKNKLKNTLF